MPTEGLDSVPAIVISLDFELRWGVHDSLGTNVSAYRANLEGVPTVVPTLLRAFTERGIRATWATVGALACSGWEEYFRRAPPPPKYVKRGLTIREEYAELDPAGALHFAPHLVDTIAATPGQDLGTHTFSHIFVRERGVTAHDVAADLAAARQIHRERYGTTPISLVFPRNEPAFLDVYRSGAIRIWRGNERAWYYDRQGPSTNHALARALRLADALNPLVRGASATEGDMSRASLFLRLNLPRTLWAAHFQRIRTELRRLGRGQVFHLWFHPHNAGVATGERLARVNEVLDLIAEGVRRGQLRSVSMRDLVDAATFDSTHAPAPAGAPN